VASDGHVHFYLGPDFDPAPVFGWDPDREPRRFASGLGHNFLELFVRLRNQGHPVSLGPIVPPQTQVIVIFPGREIWKFRRHVKLCWAVRQHRSVVIRSDLHLRFGRTVANSVQIVANPVISEDGSSGRLFYLPPLQQRGLQPRQERAAGSRLGLAYKGNPLNVPAYLTQESFLLALESLGVELKIDTPSLTDGSDQDWHDFSRADLALLDRGNTSVSQTLNKPPTKLLNAWHADVIPLYAPEPAYISLTEPGCDSLPFDGPDDLLEQLRRLVQEPDLLDRLRDGVAVRRANLAPTQEIVNSYWAVIQSQTAQPSKRRVVTAIPKSLAVLLQVRALRIIDRLRNLR
jgi:hypothetical protein